MIGFDRQAFEFRQPLIDKKRAMVSDHPLLSRAVAAVHVMAVVKGYVEREQGRQIGWILLLAWK